MSRSKGLPLGMFFETVSSTTATSILMIIGFVSGGWLLNNLWKIAYPWFYVDTPIVVFAVSAVIFRLFRPYVNFYQQFLLLSLSWLVSLMIGNVVSGYVSILTSLLPFYQNPYVLALWTDYFVILTCLVFAQKQVGKMMVLVKKKAYETSPKPHDKSRHSERTHNKR